VNDPINHHFVAQHVLRRFCDAQGVLWTYDKEAKRIYKGRPRSQACAEHFYSYKSQKSGAIDSKTIEQNFMSKIDNAGSLAIESLLRRERLTDERGIDFMRFAAAQMIRVETYFQRLEAMMSPIMQEMAERMAKYDEEFRNGLTQDLRKIGKDEKEIEEFIASLERGEFQVTANRGYIVTIFLEHIDSITAKFCQMKWGFFRIKDASEAFLLSDNPLTLEDVGEGDAQPLGIMNPNIEVMMPLSPTNIAVGRWDEEMGYGTINPDHIQVVNQRIIDQAHRYVYAPFRSEELLTRVVASQGRQARTRVKRIKDGDSLIMLHSYTR
jgi:hypothetical protein